MNPLDIMKERMNHPFLGSFSIGFIMWNWKAFIYATTGSADASERIDKIISVTIGTGEDRQWFFIYEPLIFAFVVAFIILPLGTLILDLWNHFVMVKEKNYKDKISVKWNESDELILKKTQDLCSYSRQIIALEIQNSNRNGHGINSELQKVVDLLDPMQRRDAALTKRVWNDIPKVYKREL